MRAYYWTRDVVDRTWKSGYWRALPLPGMLPMFAPLLLNSPALRVFTWTWFVLWSGFIAWRWWVYMKVEATRSDRAYDRKGKFRLVREYWGTESATSAKARKKKHGS